MKLKDFQEIMKKSVHLPSPQESGFIAEAKQYFIPPEVTSKKRFSWKNFSLRLTSVMAIFAIASVIFMGSQVKSIITVDINPSLKIELNYFDQVIGLESFNQEGAELIEQMEVKHGKPSEIIQEIIEKSIDSGYVSENEPVFVLIGVNGVSFSNEDTLKLQISENLASQTTQILFLNAHSQTSSLLYSGNVVPQQDQFSEVLDGLWPESAAADTTTVITSPTIPDYMLPSIDSDFAENKGTNSYSLSSLSGLSVEQFQTIAATYNVSETKLTLAIEIMKGNSGYTLQGDLVLLLNKPVGELITLYQNLE